MFSIDFLRKTICLNDRIELIKIRFALTINDDRILIKQSFDLNLIFSASRDFLTTFLIKIRLALTINDDRIFIKLNSNSIYTQSRKCEQSKDFDVFS